MEESLSTRTQMRSVPLQLRFYVLFCPPEWLAATWAPNGSLGEREREVKVGACIDNRPFEMCFDVSSGNTSGNLLGGIFFLATFETRKTVGALNSFTLVISHHSPPTN